MLSWPEDWLNTPMRTNFKIDTPFYLNNRFVTNSLTDLTQLINTYSFPRYSVIFIYVVCAEWNTGIGLIFRDIKLKISVSHETVGSAEARP